MAYVALGLQAIHEPGLYMDAVNPDYEVVRMTNPQSETPIYILPGNLLFGRLPVLGGLYHGSYTAYEALPFYLVFGGTMLSIRLAHLALGLLVLVAAGFALWGMTRSQLVTGIALLALAADPAFFLLFRTQAYLPLFPACFALFALYALARAPSPRGALLCGALLGLAAFGYFVYLFMIPGVLLFVWRDTAVTRRRDTLLALCGGIVLGLSPYALGYGLIFGNLGFSGGAASIQGYVHGLALNSGQSFFERVAAVVSQTWYVVTGEWEWLTFWADAHVSGLQIVKGVALVALPVLVFAFTQRPYGRAFALSGAALLSFVVTATIFGGRLGGHDMSAAVPLLYVFAGVSAATLLAHYSLRRIAYATLAFAAVVCALNVGAAAQMLGRLSSQGATGFYSDVITQYAEAAASSRAGAPYVFGDWGMMMPFVYLTSGRVPAFDGWQLPQAFCKYGSANVILLGADAIGPSARVPGARVRATVLTRDPRSGFPIEVVSVVPIGPKCAPAAPLALQPGTQLPAGVDENALATTVGVYPDAPATCCFLADRASFTVRVPPDATSLTMNVFVPGYDFYGAQRLAVRIDGRLALTSGVLSKGTTNAVVVPLLSSDAARESLRVDVAARYSYVPKALGLNDDPRRLSVILRSVSANAAVAALPSPATPATPTPLPSSLALPPGIARADAPTMRGIYPSDAATCCFIGARADFTLHLPTQTSSLTLDVYVPSYAFYGPQRLTVLVNGAIATRTGALARGSTDAIAVPLARSASRANVRVSIVPSYTYVPKEAGVNADTRRLSVILTDVTAQP